MTGPDEYTTVVNNNAYTNLMARENLWYAAGVIDGLREKQPGRVQRPRAQDASSTPARPPSGGGRPTTCTSRTTSARRCNPQDDSFLDRESLGHQEHAEGQVPAAAALPPAGDLPLPGDQAGRHRAGDVPARQRVYARAEESATSTTTTRSRPATRRCRLHPGIVAARDRLRRSGRSGTCGTPC